MTGRRALIVGAARGIGLATVNELVRTGHRVTGTWHRTEPPADTQADWKRCDITSSTDVESVFTEAAESPYDIVVANAAHLRDRFMTRMSDRDFQEVIDVNLTGTFRIARAALEPMMRQRWGRIIIIGSVGALWGLAGQTNYSASKAAAGGLVASMARECGSRGVTVNVVLPGATRTELIGSMRSSSQERWRTLIPANRFSDAAEVAAAIVFLASDVAGAITGAQIPVDGGFL